MDRQRASTRQQQQKKIAMNLGTQVRSGDLVLKLEKLVVGYQAGDE